MLKSLTLDKITMTSVVANEQSYLAEISDLGSMDGRLNSFGFRLSEACVTTSDPKSHELVYRGFRLDIMDYGGAEIHVRRVMPASRELYEIVVQSPKLFEKLFEGVQKTVPPYKPLS